MFGVSVVCNAFRLHSSSALRRFWSLCSACVVSIVVRWSESYDVGGSNATAPLHMYGKREWRVVVAVIYGVDYLTDGKTHSKQHHSTGNRIHTSYKGRALRGSRRLDLCQTTAVASAHRVSSSFCAITHSAKTNAIYICYYYASALSIFFITFYL